MASAGLAVSRVSGEAEPLGFTRFWLGVHSVLFSEDVRLRAALGPSTHAGGYLGASVGIDLARHLALAASLRVLLAGEADVPARIDTIIDTTGGTVSRDPGDLARSLSPVPARLAPGRLAVAIGMTVR